MFNSSPRRRKSAAFLVSAVGLLAAQRAEGATRFYHFTINPLRSDVYNNTSLQAPVPGTVIGNYDAATNTTGTQTRPGLFGGSGNVAVPFNITFVTSGEFDAHPAGLFTIALDAGANSIAISNFSADLLNGSPATQDLTLNLLYQSFHTVQPTSIFPGGITIPLPLGQANLTLLTLVQTGGEAITGVLIPAGRNTFAFSVTIAAELTMQADALGQPISLGPIPAPVLLNGTISTSGNTAAANVAFDFAFDQTIPGPFPGGTLENVALDVPTVLPTGSTAHLLFNGELASLAASLELESAINANGQIFHPGDVTNNGAVNVDDLLLIINSWGACPAESCPADINHDGTVDIIDLNMVLDDWS